MELTRKQVIEELQKMLDYCSIRQDSTPERKQALVYAISSLKTDEAYQIMYEGGEIYTKADMVDMLEQLDSEIQEQIAFMGDGEETNGMKRADNLVKDKINALKQSIWQDNYNGKKETNK